MRKTTKKCGATRLKLAALLQKSFFFFCIHPLTWDPDHLFPAQGRYRSDKNIDCYRWTGYAKYVRPDGTSFTMVSVGSYSTMTSLIKAKELFMSDSGEVYAE